MRALRRLRARRVRRWVTEQRAFYARDWSVDSARAWQLEQFNQMWSAATRSVEYFAKLQRDRGLPRAFRGWGEFTETMPTMDRTVLQRERRALVSADRQPDAWRTTGGSTAQPIQIPVWRSERQVAAADMWYARRWFGVAPEDRLFLIWGHSHLFGRGARGWVNARARQIKDALLAYRRWSAYDLGDDALRRAGDALLSFRPSYLIGYAIALDRFARVNRDRAAAFAASGIKVAIATAESFPRSDSLDVIEQVLGCPVAMEYGSVETGPIAHQSPGGRYTVFWRHYFVEGIPSPDVPDACEIVVTSLYPRSVPLVRYRVGDLVRPGAATSSLHQRFDSVIGRCNDYVVLANGALIHSETFAHVVKDIPSITGYQVTQARDGRIALTYVGRTLLAADDVATIRHRLERVTPDLASVDISRVDALERTIAGKTRSVVRAHREEGAA